MNTKRLLLTALIAAPMIVGIQSQTSVIDAYATDKYSEIAAEATTTLSYTPVEKITKTDSLARFIYFSNFVKENITTINGYFNKLTKSDAANQIYKFIDTLAKAKFEALETKLKEVSGLTETKKILKSISDLQYQPSAQDKTIAKQIYKLFKSKAKDSIQALKFTVDEDNYKDTYIAQFYASLLTDAITALKIFGIPFDQNSVTNLRKSDTAFNNYLDTLATEKHLTSDDVLTYIVSEDGKTLKEGEFNDIKASINAIFTNNQAREYNFEKSAKQHAAHIFKIGDTEYKLALKGREKITAQPSKIDEELNAQNARLLKQDKTLDEIVDLTDTETQKTIIDLFKTTKEVYTEVESQLKKEKLNITDSELASSDKFEAYFAKKAESLDYLSYDESYDAFMSAKENVSDEHQEALPKSAKEIYQFLYTQKKKGAEGIDDLIWDFGLCVACYAKDSVDDQVKDLYKEVKKRYTPKAGEPDLPDDFGALQTELQRANPKFEVKTPTIELTTITLNDDNNHERTINNIIAQSEAELKLLTSSMVNQKFANSNAVIKQLNTQQIIIKKIAENLYTWAKETKPSGN